MHSILDTFLPYIPQRGYELSIALCVAACTIIVARRWISRRAIDSKEENVVKTSREHGEWTPVEFRYPKVQPIVQELKDIKPIPYRPFRWGKYNVTMGIRNMSWSEWIELDNQYETYQRIRKHRIQTRGQNAVRVLGDDANPGVVRGGGEAAIELVHELAEYLSRRYPQSFKIERHMMTATNDSEPLEWDGLPPIKEVTVVPLNTIHRLPLNIDDGENASSRAMEIAALLIQDDLALMIEGNDGRYYFQAGAICVPGFWRMKDKIGLPLDEIHLTGNVPQYREKLHTSLERFFRRMTVDKPVTRNNFFVQVVRSADAQREDDIDPEELGWSESSNGAEDEFEHGHAFAGPLPNQAPPTPGTLRMRTERQTLRRLPRSGGIVFTIRTYLAPVEELAKERGVPGRMASSIRGWGADIVEYKGMERNGWGPVLLGYLDKRHQEQVERGEVGDEERAGEREYPY